MKVRYLLPILAVFVIGCVSMDPETSLYQSVRSGADEGYTLYNYPSIYLTSKEQKIRAAKQAESIRKYVKVGMTESQLAEIWGRPNDIKKSKYPDSILDTFIYESTGGQYMPVEHYYFNFRDKLLESWHRI